MRKTFLEHWPVLSLLILSLLIVWPTFLLGYFSHHDDLQVMRIFEMRRCLEDLQIPCRWVPDLGFGNGFPLFNYYGVFPYYLGAILSLVLGFVGAAKALFFISLILGGVTMYLLARELFGKVPGFLAALFYTFAPYRALDSYVRGAVTESFSLSLIPLVFYFCLRLIRKNSVGNFLGLALSLGAFLTTHNIMTMFFMLPLLVWVGYWLLWERCKHYLVVAGSFLLGVGLAAFFLLPAFLEQSLIQTETLTRFYMDFRVHFVTFKQLFLNRSWEYGASVLGPWDGMSFQVGWPHWWMVVVSLLMAGYLVLTGSIKKNCQLWGLGTMLVAVFMVATFMSHNKSAFVWENIPLLWYAQFPWRFLSLSIFSASLLSGWVVMFIKGKGQYLVTFLLGFLVVWLNWGYFRPEKFYPLSDQEKLSGRLWLEQQRASILDYLPKTALEPREPAPTQPVVVSGKADVANFVKQSNRWEFRIDVDKSSVVEMPIFDFPNWQVEVNGEKITHSNRNFLGRISLNLAPGSYKVVGKFQDTPTRAVSNFISALSWLIILLILSYGKIRKILK